MIEFSTVVKSFGNQRVLQGLSFAAQDGRVTGFVGPNGAGKSTAFKILLGLLPAEGGYAQVDGLPYRRTLKPGKVLGAYLGPQHTPGMMTGRSYLAYTADLLGIPRSQGDYYLESVSLADAADRRVAEYSLGMRQRLGVAAAFMGEPQNLVLDEPVNGLDVAGVRWLRDYLRSAAQAGRCVLLSSHLLSELEMVADDVVMLQDGKTSRSGSLRELQSESTDIISVVTQDSQALLKLLQAERVTAQVVNGVVEVVGVSINQVAAILGRSSTSFTSLACKSKRLEDVYFEQFDASENHSEVREGMQ